MTIKLEVRHLYKIFGKDPDKAFQLLERGNNKDEIFNETGMTVGVQDANLSVKEGEIFVVMGLSGSGKSTLVRLLNRLIEPTRGEVLIDGENILKMNPTQLRQLRRSKISMVFQSFALMPHLTVLNNAAFGLELSGVAPEEREAKALSALAQVGLEGQANSYPDELSGGMQQRVGLARALANDPDILLMDEAFSALDPLIRSEMQEELMHLQAEHQRTVIFISHDLDEAMRIGDRIAIMQGGEVVQVGTPDEILHHPANDYVRSFFKGVDVSNVFAAGDIARHTQVTLVQRGEDTGLRTAMQRLKEYDRDYGYVLDRHQKYLGTVSVDSLRSALKDEQTLKQAYLEQMEPLRADTPINEILSHVAQAPCAVPVIDKHHEYIGAISRSTLLETLDREA